MLIVARAPVPISFAGGGTDHRAYCERHGGLVVSTTIDYYVYTILAPTQQSGARIIYADHRTLGPYPSGEDPIWDGDLRLPDAIIGYFNVADGVNVFLASQVPSGTGLGSSGGAAVSMIKALAFWCGLDMNPPDVAELACKIEIEQTGGAICKHDPYAAAFGGLNCITLAPVGVEVEPLSLPAETREGLARGLMLFFPTELCQFSTCLSHREAVSRQDHQAAVGTHGATAELGLEIRAALEQGDLTAFGNLLHRSWMEKRRDMDDAADRFLDQCYQVAVENGALGGKVIRARSGGSLILFCPENRQDAVTQALDAQGLQRRPVTLEREGVQVMQAEPWMRARVGRQMPRVMAS